MTKTIEMLRAAIFTGALCFLPAGAQAEGVPDHNEAEEPAEHQGETCQKAGEPRNVPDHQEAQTRCGDDEKGVVRSHAPGEVPDHQESEARGGAK